MTEGEQPLKPKGLPNNPTGLLRCRYKYSKDNEDYYILADFEINTRMTLMSLGYRMLIGVNTDT
jgi:hypothetical protein